MRRIAAEELDAAIDQLSALARVGDIDVEATVHDVRRSCKKVRGLIRMVRPALGSHYRRSNTALRDAAAELSTLRDAHASLETIEGLRGAGDDDVLEVVRERHARSTRAVSLDRDDRRVRRARKQLRAVRSTVEKWRVPHAFGPIAGGVGETYRRGRRGLRTATAAGTEPSDEILHEWRKRVKYLWYQTRLLQGLAPSVLVPLADSLGELGEALGDCHDLFVLSDALGAEGPDDSATRRAQALAREQRDDLADRAVRLGTRVYAERPSAFVERLRRYWDAAEMIGAERPLGDDRSPWRG